MKYLVTGHLGFIGSRVAALLTEQGEEWLGIDQELDPTPDRPWRYMGDIPSDALGRFDAIINCAGMAGAPYSNTEPSDYWTNNVTEAVDLFQHARLASVPVVHCSSAMVGDDSTHYYLTKKAAEEAAKLENRLGASIKIVRIHNVFGPDQPPGFVVPTFIHRISEGMPVALDNGGEAVKHYVYVDDVAQALVAAVPLASTRIYHAAGPKASVRELAEIVARVLGEDLVSYDREMPERARERKPVASFEAWERTWSPQVGLEAGIRETARSIGVLTA